MKINIVTAKINYEKKNVFAKLGDGLLSPTRRLLHGKNVTVVNGKITQLENYLTPWYRTALNIALFVPSLLLGLFFKGISLLGPSMRKSLNAAKSEMKNLNNCSLPKPVQTSSYNINEAHDKRAKEWHDTLQKITSKKSWKNPEIIKKVDELMRDAYQETLFIFEDAAEKSKNQANPAANMSKLLAMQGNSPYCYNFFYENLVEMYHMARSCTYLTEDRYSPGNKCYNPLTELTNEDQAPYFNPQTPQYQWRMMYLECCKLIDKYGLRAHLEKDDKRYLSWTKPDLYKRTKTLETHWIRSLKRFPGFEFKHRFPKLRVWPSYFPTFPDTRPT